MTLSQFCDKVKKSQAERAIPNFALSIIHPEGDVILVGGDKTDEATLFPIGSLSKAFAATVMGTLVDKGLVKWQDSIQQYIDIKLPNNIDLTIYQLLSHINPLPEHALTEASELGFSRQELVEILQYIKVSEVYKFSYQNILFSLVADIVLKITGTRYEDYLREAIFIPLGMRLTTAEEKSYLQNQNKAPPYIKQKDKITPIPYSPFWHIMGPPSCVSTSIADLTRWLKFNLQLEPQSIISQESLNAIQCPLKKSQPPYAMGWWKADEQGLVLCHTGSVTGYDSVIAMIPSRKIGITLCANLSGDAFIYDLIDEFIQQELQEKTFHCKNILKLTMPLTKPKLPLDKFVGVFEDPILEKIEVKLENENLIIRVGKKQVQAQLAPIALARHHAKITHELAELAPHHCFEIHWQGTMTAAGSVYYDEDKIAFAQNEAGQIDALILLADAISASPLVCKRSSTLSLESKNHGFFKSPELPQQLPSVSATLCTHLYF